MKKYNAPRVRESRGVQILTTIWLVPFIALIIALWLGYQYYIKIGSKVTITFKSNAGLVENQSPIKMRDVTVGIVKQISLSKDGEGVIIKARMNTAVSDYLNETAKFWIVHPDVGSQGISGLDTIVSGSYIEIYGKKDKETKHQYVGLEHPYIDDNAKGIYFVLSAPKSYNVSEKGIIYYRMMEIGRVERVAISPDGTHVNFTIFVEEEYVKFINSSSKFYAKSNFNIDFSNRNLDITTAPFSQIIHGGISVYTPVNSLDKNNTLKNDRIFRLYKNFAQMKSKQLGSSGDFFYKLVFKEAISKLQIGSPVEFKNFQVGYITDIKSKYSKKSKKIENIVYILIHTDAFNSSGNIDGLKAKISSSIPIVGTDFIELFFDKRKKLSPLVKKDDYFIIPIEKAVSKKNILDSVSGLLDKLKKLPLEELLQTATKLLNENRKPVNHLVKDLDKTVNSFNKVVKNFNNTVNNLNNFTSNSELNMLPKTINNSLNELEVTLIELQRLTQEYSGDSKFADQLSLTLKSISEASKSFDKTNKMLERKANALVVGDK